MGAFCLKNTLLKMERIMQEFSEEEIKAFSEREPFTTRVQKIIENKTVSDESLGLNPIYDFTDATEAFIKCNISYGDVFPSKKALLERIGAELCHVSNFNGGKQVAKAERYISQYLSFARIEPNKQPVQILEIFDVPEYFDFSNGTGRRGIYVDKIKTMLIGWHRNSGRTQVVMSTVAIAGMVGFINNNYIRREQLYKEFKKYDSRMSADMVDQAANRSRRYFSNYIVTALDSLQRSQYLSWYYVLLIKQKNGQDRLPSGEEANIITDVQLEVKTEFGYTDVDIRINYKKRKKYYAECQRRAKERILENTGVEIRGYYIAVHIDYDTERIRAYLKENDIQRGALFQTRKDISKLFMDRMRRTIRMEYQNNLNRSVRQADEYHAENNPEYAESILYTNLTPRQKASATPLVFFLPEYYIEVQDELVHLMNDISVSQLMSDEERDMGMEENVLFNDIYLVYNDYNMDAIEYILFGEPPR